MLSPTFFSAAICVTQLMALFLNHHHLYTFSHPRRDSYMLLLLEAVVCARRFAVAGVVRAQAAAAASGLPPSLPVFGGAVMVASFVAAWMFTSGRPLFDALLLVPGGACTTFTTQLPPVAHPLR